MPIARVRTGNPGAITCISEGAERDHQARCRQGVNRLEDRPDAKRNAERKPCNFRGISQIAMTLRPVLAKVLRVRDA